MSRLRILLKCITILIVTFIVASCDAFSSELVVLASEFSAFLNIANAKNKEWKQQSSNDQLIYDDEWTDYINTSGKLKGKGLACNSYASALLVAYLYNDDFRLLKADRSYARTGDKDWIHQWFGKDTARYLGLEQSYHFKSVTEFLDETDKKPGESKLKTGIYYFDLRDMTAETRSYKKSIKENGHSHTGFLLIIKGDNRILVIQEHFSSLYNGRAQGSFELFLFNSVYGKTDEALDSSDIMLYKVEPFPIGRVTASKLRIRDKPNEKGTKILGKADKKHVVQIKKTESGWHEIRYINKGKVIEGWVSGKYVLYIPSAPPKAPRMLRVVPY